MKENQLDIFSTPIWNFFLDEHGQQAIDYCDHILANLLTEPSMNKSNLGGWQSRDNLHQTEPLLHNLVLSLNKMSNDALDDAVFKPVCITEMWANVNGKYCSNLAHIHSGILSGVLYLQVPKGSGRLILRNPAVRSDAHFIRSGNYVIEPGTLVCVIFPSWLEHYVEPNLSDAMRISLSFNIGIDRANTHS